MEEHPKIIVDEQGYLRIVFADGKMLPETKLTITNYTGDKDMCEVTVTFMCKHNLKNKE